MKLSPVQLALTTLAIGIIAYATATLVGDYRTNWDRSANSIGNPLFPNLNLNDIRKIVITDAAGKLELKQDSGHWIVEKQNGYPADFVKLKQLTKQIREARVLNTYLVDEGGINKLRLAPPGGTSANAGCMIQLINGSNETLASVIVGIPHKNVHDGAVMDGRYARVKGSSEAVILRYQFSEATSDAPSWIDRSFPSTKCARRIQLSDNGETLWRLSRENESRLLSMDNLGKGTALNQEIASRLENAVAYARYSELGDPTAPLTVWGFSNKHFQFEDFDGMIYTFDLGEVTPDALMPVRVSVELSQSVQPTVELRERLQREKRLYKGWVYLLPRATFAPLTMKRDELIKATSENAHGGFEVFPDGE